MVTPSCPARICVGGAEMGCREKRRREGEEIEERVRELKENNAKVQWLKKMQISVRRREKKGASG